METLAIIFYLFLFAFLVTGLSALFFKSRGPWGSYWSTFLIIFFFVWITALWIKPIGPEYFGISWGPIVFVAILMSILLYAVTPPYYRHWSSKINKDDLKEKLIRDKPEPVFALGIIFWSVIVILLIAIALGYWI